MGFIEPRLKYGAALLSPIYPMKVYITRPVSAGAHGCFARGDTPELSSEVAAALMSSGKAIPYVAPARVEVAAVHPPTETASVAQPAKKRRSA